MILTITITLLVTWCGSTYSGQFKTAQKWIDQAADFVHTNFFAPAIVNTAMNIAVNFFEKLETTTDFQMGLGNTT